MAEPVKNPLMEGIASAVPFLSAGLNVAGGLFGQKRNYKYSKRLAEFQYQKNLQMMDYQNAYNSPAAQMARYKEAGLNPHLIYGQGSSGNMQSAPQYPDVQIPDYAQVYGNLGSQIQQAQMVAAQTDLTQMKTQESGVKQQVMKMQEAVLSANPNLNPKYVNAMITNMESTAAIKAQQKGFLESWTTDPETGVRWERGFLKMQREIDLLTQKLRLGEKDLKIKAELVESIEFKNALLEIQKKWLQDGDITPQHIYQGILMMLTKMM